MAEKLNSILVDDEDNSLSALRLMIDDYCPNVHILGEAKSVGEGVEIINKAKPDLVFLDIRMPDGEGFDVLQQVDHKTFEVIITTACRDYALKAYEFSAIDYLLKPINYLDLQKAVERVGQIRSLDYFDNRLQLIRVAFAEQQKRIMLPTSDGFEIFEIQQIIRCESDGCYTRFYFNNREKPVLISNTMATYDRLFSDLSFFRIHNRHLVNLRFVKKYSRADGGFVILNDETYLKISERKKGPFLERLKMFARG